jgi:hypothetical protein
MESKNYQKFILIFFILAALFSSMTYFHDSMKMVIKSDFYDFGDYYFHAALMKNHHNIYEATPETRDRFKKSLKMPKFCETYACHPVLLLSIIPFTFFPYKLAAALWLIVNNILLIVTVLLIIKLVKNKIRFDLSTLALVFMTFSFQSLIETTWLGNLNIPLLFLLVVMLLFLKKGNHFFAGILLAMVIMFKHQYGLLLLFFLWKGNFKVFLSTCLSMLMLEGLTMLYAGWSTHLSYWNLLNNMFGTGILGGGFRSYSLNSFLCRVFGMAKLSNLASLLGMPILIYTIYITKGKRKGSDSLLWLEFSLVLTTIMIITPLVQDTHYVLLYLPFFLFWYKLVEYKEEIKLWVLFIISFLLISLKYSLIGFPIFHEGILSLFYYGKLYGVVCLYLLGVKIIQREKRNEQIPITA